jgi:hypothetical protein
MEKARMERKLQNTERGAICGVVVIIKTINLTNDMVPEEYRFANVGDVMNRSWRIWVGDQAQSIPLIASTTKAITLQKTAVGLHRPSKTETIVSTASLNTTVRQKRSLSGVRSLALIETCSTRGLDEVGALSELSQRP